MHVLRRVVAVFAVLLIAATWRLWTPQDVFPQVPFLESLCRAPAWLDWMALAGMATGVLLSFVGGPSHQAPRAASALFALSLLLSVLLDQHRLQPWAYQFLVISMVLAVSPTDRGLRLLRTFVASIYLWSAVSKIDAAFVESHGQLLLGGLLRSIGLSFDLWSETARRGAAASFPVAELLIGLALLVPRTRSLGVWAAAVMHVLLLLALGPLGLAHKPAVLIWNVYFIGQNLALFRSERALGAVPAPTSDVRRPISDRLATALVVLVIAAPLLEPWGWFDHWPAWAVYSSRPSIVTVWITDARVGDLPAEVRDHVGPREPLSEWRPLNVDSWSFSTLNCPVYPQERFRLAVAEFLSERAAADDVRVRVQSSPDRRSGERTMSELQGAAAIRRQCDAFWINTRSRAKRAPDAPQRPGH